MKKLMFATALVASAAAFAAPINAISFEGYNVDAGVGSGVGDTPDVSGGDTTAFFYYAGDTGAADGSKVQAFGSGEPSVAARPAYFASATPNEKYLKLDTEGGTLWRSLAQSSANGLGTAQAVAAAGTYLDTLVQFTVTEDGAAPSLDGADKLAIWLNAENGVTNLMVRANLYDFNETPIPTATSFSLVAAEGAKAIVADQWYRLTVKAIPNVFTTDEFGVLTAFEIYIDNVQMCATTPQFTTTMVNTLGEMDVLSAEMSAAISANKIFPALGGLGAQGSTPTLQGVGFKGSGAVDDIVWTEDDPFPAQTIDFTLTWPSGYTAVSYTIDGGAPVAISGNSPLQVPDLTGGETIAFTFRNADGVEKTSSATAVNDGDIAAGAAVYTWADYLGDAVDGAYEIDDLAELKLFQKGIATTTNELKLATAGETFKLTADITLDEAWPGVGVQNGKDFYSTADFNAAAFQGTFDGQNHTISGFQMIGKGDKAEGLDYCGFFNSTYSATIQNLKIAYAGGLFAADTTASTKESGATFVGVAKNSTLDNLTTVAGTVSCSKGFGGIVGYLTSGTTVQNCTNNLNMTSLANNKCGGIAMIAQGGSAVTISNCQNNGTMTTGSSNSEYGGIIGYVGLNITIADCETTVGRFLKHQGGTITLQGVNKGDATVAGYHGMLTPGLNYATGDGTFVADNALAIDGVYTVMAETNDFAVTFVFEEAGAISFNTNYAQRATFNVTKDASLKSLTSSAADGVVTYTAVAYATPTVTVNGGANATATWTVNGAPAASAPATLTEGDTYAVFYTANQDYHFAENAVTNASGTAGTENIVITIDDAVADQSAGWVDDPAQIAEDTTAAAQYSALAGSALADADAKELTVWAKDNSVVFTAVTSAPGDYVEAFLLNCAPTAVAVDKEKEEFVLSISFDGSGNPVVSTPDGKTYNGKLQLKGKANLNDATWTNISAPSSSYKFYMYELGL